MIQQVQDRNTVLGKSCDRRWDAVRKVRSDSAVCLPKCAQQHGLGEIAVRVFVDSKRSIVNQSNQRRSAISRTKHIDWIVHVVMVSRSIAVKTGSAAGQLQVAEFLAEVSKVARFFLLIFHHQNREETRHSHRIEVIQVTTGRIDFVKDSFATIKPGCGIIVLLQ